MPSTFDAFERNIKIATAGLEPQAINAQLARFAKQELRRVIASGEASSTYDRYVNGVRGAIEESVRVPGVIVYEFVNWPLVIRAVLAELQARSPVKTGRYAAGFVVLANGKLVRDYSEIPAKSEVIIFNVRPYTRKVEMGVVGSGRPHFLATKRVMSARFREAFIIETKFLNIGPGVHADVPYRLKRGQGRQGREAGTLLTYPAIIINKAH